MSTERYDIGLEVRKQVLGDAYVDRAISGADDFNREFQEFVTEYCPGSVWGKTVLSNKQRSLNDLCMLAALNRRQEFKPHFRGAIRDGCTLDELNDTLPRIAVYCGVPAAVEGFRLARAVLDKDGIAVGGGA